MTKEEILQLVGNELNAEVASKIMGIKVEYPYAAGYPYYLREDKGWRDGGGPKMKWNIVPNYGDIVAAWGVVEKLEALGYYIEIMANILGERRIRFTLLGAYLGTGVGHKVISQGECLFRNIKEVPEAICRAALLCQLEVT